MFCLQHHLVVLCKGAPLWPLTYFSGELSRALWALLSHRILWNHSVRIWLSLSCVSSCMARRMQTGTALFPHHQTPTGTLPSTRTHWARLSYTWIRLVLSYLKAVMTRSCHKNSLWIPLLFLYISCFWILTSASAWESKLKNDDNLLFSFNA